MNAFKGKRNPIPVDAELSKLRNRGVYPSFSQAQFVAWSNSVHDALKHSMIADNKGTAEAILKLMKNQADVMALIKAYGYRQRYMFGFPDGGKTDLPTTIRDEFSSSRIARVNKDYQSKGITFKF